MTHENSRPEKSSSCQGMPGFSSDNIFPGGYPPQQESDMFGTFLRDIFLPKKSTLAQIYPKLLVIIYVIGRFQKKRSGLEQIWPRRGQGWKWVNKRLHFLRFFSGKKWGERKSWLRYFWTSTFCWHFFKDMFFYAFLISFGGLTWRPNNPGFRTDHGKATWVQLTPRMELASEKTWKNKKYFGLGQAGQQGSRLDDFPTMSMNFQCAPIGDNLKHGKYRLSERVHLLPSIYTGVAWKEHGKNRPMSCRISLI